MIMLLLQMIWFPLNALSCIIIISKIRVIAASSYSKVPKVYFDTVPYINQQAHRIVSKNWKKEKSPQKVVNSRVEALLRGSVLAGADLRVEAADVEENARLLEGHSFLSAGNPGETVVPADI